MAWPFPASLLSLPRRGRGWGGGGGGGEDVLGRWPAVLLPGLWSDINHWQVWRIKHVIPLAGCVLVSLSSSHPLPPPPPPSVLPSLITPSAPLRSRACRPAPQFQVISFLRLANSMAISLVIQHLSIGRDPSPLWALTPCGDGRRGEEWGRPVTRREGGCRGTECVLRC